MSRKTYKRKGGAAAFLQNAFTPILGANPSTGTGGTTRPYETVGGKKNKRRTQNKRTKKSCGCTKWRLF